MSPEAPSDRAVARVQSISGLVFATFLALHLGNTLFAIAGQANHEGYQRVARRYYQHPLVEVSVIAVAGLVHACAGAVRILRRRRRRGAASPARVSLRTRLHRYSGWFLLVIAGFHALATRGPGLLYGVPADFAFLNFSLTTVPLFFYPYYAAFALAGIYHLANGLLLALALLGAPVPRSATAAGARPFFAVVAVLGVLALAALPALGGAYFPVDTHRFAEFRALYNRFIPAAFALKE